MVKKTFKKYLFISALLFLFFPANNHAFQVSIGVEGGVALNSLNTPTDSRQYTEYKARAGVMVGIPVRFHFTDFFALGTGVRYTQKNHRWERGLMPDFDIYSNSTNGFLQVPVFASFAFAPFQGRSGVTFFFDAGATVGFWLHSSRRGVLMDVNLLPQSFNERLRFDNTRDNRFDASLYGGLGVKYVMERISPFISVQYHRGLTDMQRNYMRDQVPRYNNTIIVQAGFFFRGSR
ncbi:MAG: PorT family protein [Treponema sp.]|jgi:hypothetical protein|nr:PorT family protein [Treponema sp.]